MKRNIRGTHLIELCLILSLIAVTALGCSHAIGLQKAEAKEPSEIHEIKVVTITPVREEQAEAQDFDLDKLSIIRKEGEEDGRQDDQWSRVYGAVSGKEEECTDPNGTDGSTTGTDEDSVGSDESVYEDDGYAEQSVEYYPESSGEYIGDTASYADGDGGTDGGGEEYLPKQPEPVGEDFAEEEPPADEANWIYYGAVTVTHYCNCEICCGVAGNRTASGTYPTPYYTVASGEDLPFGTEIMINGQTYVVEDRGVGVGCIDIFVPDHEQALAMGMYTADMYIRG